MNPTVGPNKAIAAGVAGSVSVLVIWILGTLGITVPPEVSSAATTLVSTLFAWLVPHGGTA